MKLCNNACMIGQGGKNNPHCSLMFMHPSSTCFRFQDSSKLDVGSWRQPDSPFFDQSTLTTATDSFSSAKKLGQGGFGPICKVFLATNDT